jgi:hypothetical protein
LFFSIFSTNSKKKSNTTFEIENKNSISIPNLEEKHFQCLFFRTPKTKMSLPSSFQVSPFSIFPLSALTPKYFPLRSNVQNPLQFSIFKLRDSKTHKIAQQRMEAAILEKFVIGEMGVAVDAPVISQSTHCAFVFATGKTESQNLNRRIRDGEEESQPTILFHPTFEKATKISILGFVLANVGEEGNLNLKINCFFVQNSVRRLKLAEKLIDFLRSVIIPGFRFERSSCRFSEPTSDGVKFLISYLKDEIEESEEEKIIEKFTFRYF